MNFRSCFTGLLMVLALLATSAAFAASAERDQGKTDHTAANNKKAAAEKQMIAAGHLPVQEAIEDQPANELPKISELSDDAQLKAAKIMLEGLPADLGETILLSKHLSKELSSLPNTPITIPMCCEVSLANAWSSDHKHMISATGFHIDLYNMTDHTHRFIDTFNLIPQSFITTIAFSPRGIFAHGQTGRVYLWNTQKQRLSSIYCPHEIYSMEFSPDGNILVVGTRDATHVWDVSNPADPQFLVTNQNEEASGITWSPGGQFFATRPLSNELSMWSRDGRLIKKFNGPGPANRRRSRASLAWSPDGALICEGTQLGRGSDIVMWNVSDINNVRPMHHITGLCEIYKVSWSPCGQLCAVATENKHGRGRVLIVNRNGKLLMTLKTGDTNTALNYDTYCSGVAWSPDGKLLKVMSKNGKLRIWKMFTIEEMLKGTPHKDQTDQKDKTA